MARMHIDELEIDEVLVRRLLAGNALSLSLSPWAVVARPKRKRRLEQALS
jgi:hypothetical protein